MELPNLEAAEVSQEKVAGYLLNPQHPDGAGKAMFFAALGYRSDQWRVLAEDLRQLAKNWPITKSVESIHGWKYIVDGIIDTPSGKSANLRTIWIVDRGSPAPRLITAYPREAIT